MNAADWPLVVADRASARRAAARHRARRRPACGCCRSPRSLGPARATGSRCSPRRQPHRAATPPHPARRRRTGAGTCSTRDERAARRCGSSVFPGRRDRRVRHRRGAGDRRPRCRRRRRPARPLSSTSRCCNLTRARTADARYRMLETMREYGDRTADRAAKFSRLSASRQARWFAALARRARGAAAHARTRSSALAAAERRSDNMHRARCASLGRRRRCSQTQRLAFSLLWYWVITGEPRPRCGDPGTVCALACPERATPVALDPRSAGLRLIPRARRRTTESGRRRLRQVQRAARRSASSSKARPATRPDAALMQSAVALFVQPTRNACQTRSSSRSDPLTPGSAASTAHASHALPRRTPVMSRRAQRVDERRDGVRGYPVTSGARRSSLSLAGTACSVSTATSSLRSTALEEGDRAASRGCRAGDDDLLTLMRLADSRLRRGDVRASPRARQRGRAISGRNQRPFVDEATIVRIGLAARSSSRLFGDDAGRSADGRHLARARSALSP